MKQPHYKRSQRTDPMFDGYEHVANATKMLRAPDASHFYELEKHSGSLAGALRYVGARAKMPRKSAAEQEKKKADERLAVLQ